MTAHRVSLIVLFFLGGGLLVWLGWRIGTTTFHTGSSPSLFSGPPAVLTTDPSLGLVNAPVTLIVYGDFQCEFCQQMRDTLATVRQSHADDLRIVWKDFPNEALHPEAIAAAEAARCAGEQDRFWDYHDLLFANQDDLSSTLYGQLAEALSLDMTLFSACLDSGGMQSAVLTSYEVGKSVGVSGTPYLFINTRAVDGVLTVSELEDLIAAELAS